VVPLPSSFAHRAVMPPAGASPPGPIPTWGSVALPVGVARGVSGPTHLPSHYGSSACASVPCGMSTAASHHGMVPVTIACASGSSRPEVAGGPGSGDEALPVGSVPCLTAGLPTPDAVQTQKENYARSLEVELKQGVELLGATHKQKTEYLHATANQQKHQYNTMLDQQVKQEEMLLSQQYNEQLMMLQQAAQQQRAELEQQAAGLQLAWEQRQTQEEFLKEQMGIQQRYAQVQRELAAEMERVAAAQAVPMCNPTRYPQVACASAVPMHSPAVYPQAQPMARYGMPPMLQQLATYEAPPLAHQLAPGIAMVPMPTAVRCVAASPAPPRGGSFRVGTPVSVPRSGSYVPQPGQPPLAPYEPTASRP